MDSARGVLFIAWLIVFMMSSSSSCQQDCNVEIVFRVQHSRTGWPSAQIAMWTLMQVREGKIRLAPYVLTGPGRSKSQYRQAAGSLGMLHRPQEKSTRCPVEQVDRSARYICWNAKGDESRCA